MIKSKTSLGIDISDGWVNLAKLSSGKNGICLLKTSQSQIPSGMIRDGNIEDPAGLAKLIKELVTANKMNAKHVAISAIAQPMLVQIMDLPKEHSVNVSQFIRDEMKNYATLPMNNVLVDFCGLSSGKNASRRAMVAAAASEKLDNFTKILIRSGLNIVSVEPALVAYIRSFYAKKIAKKFDKKLLFAIIRDGELTICLFKNQVLEFVQTKRLDKDILVSDQCCKWLAEEINAVIGFYENEYPEDRATWEVTLISDLFKDQTDQNSNALGFFINGVTLNIVFSQQAWLDTPVINSSNTLNASAVAIGLAMKHIDCPANNLNINLLPETIGTVKAAKKQTAAAFNIAAVILFLSVLSIVVLSISERKMKDKLQLGKQTLLQQNSQMLLDEQTLLNSQIAKVTKKLNDINDVVASEKILKWADILQNISLTVPKTVRITELYADNNNEITIEGVAASYTSVNLFVDKLNESDCITQAAAIDTRKDKETNGMINYSIKCSLAQ